MESKLLCCVGNSAHKRKTAVEYLNCRRLKETFQIILKEFIFEDMSKRNFPVCWRRLKVTIQLAFQPQAFLCTFLREGILCHESGLTKQGKGPKGSTIECTLIRQFSKRTRWLALVKIKIRPDSIVSNTECVF